MEQENKAIDEKSKDTAKATIEAKQEEKAELSAEEKLQIALEESKDKYLRLYSEFENFRRRTAKEKLELIGSANERLLQSVLPVLDDFERAEKAFATDTAVAEVKKGVDLVYNKFKGVLEQKGVKAMEISQGSNFDVAFHEAITQIPAPKKELKGKIIDVVEQGYLLNDKVIRFAKVVTGA